MLHIHKIRTPISTLHFIIPFSCLTAQLLFLQIASAAAPKTLHAKGKDIVQISSSSDPTIGIGTGTEMDANGRLKYVKVGHTAPKPVGPNFDYSIWGDIGLKGIHEYGDERMDYPTTVT
jgi:hypothetical protein